MIAQSSFADLLGLGSAHTPVSSGLASMSFADLIGGMPIIDAGAAIREDVKLPWDFPREPDYKDTIEPSLETVTRLMRKYTTPTDHVQEHRAPTVAKAILLAEYARFDGSAFVTRQGKRYAVKQWDFALLASRLLMGVRIAVRTDMPHRFEFIAGWKTLV